jgi:hypothetical protein
MLHRVVDLAETLERLREVVVRVGVVGVLVDRALVEIARRCMSPAANAPLPSRRVSGAV